MPCPVKPSTRVRKRKAAQPELINTLQDPSHLSAAVIQQISKASDLSVKEKNAMRPEAATKPKYKPSKFNCSMQPFHVSSPSFASVSSFSNSLSSPMSSLTSPASLNTQAQTAEEVAEMFLANDRTEEEEGGTSDEDNGDGFNQKEEEDSDNDESNVQQQENVEEGTSLSSSLSSSLSTPDLVATDKWIHLRQIAEKFVFNNGDLADPSDINTFIPEDFDGGTNITGTNKIKPFHEIDNPGNWPPFCYTAKRMKGGGYVYHRLPGGATPVEKTADFSGPIRSIGGCKVYYGGPDGTWGVNPDTDPFCSRSFATPIDMLPKERGTVLDCDKLKQYGVNKEIVAAKDSLFWVQLLLPLTDTNGKGGINKFDKNGRKIVHDERKPYYPKVATFSCQNMINNCGNADNCHTSTKLFSSKEEIQFDGITIANGNVGGDYDYHNLWDPNDDKYSKHVKNCSLKPTRFLDVKKYRKYNDNIKGKLYCWCNRFPVL